MSTWQSDNNYGYTLVIGQDESAIFARVHPVGSIRQASIAALVRTPVFPTLEREGFTTMQAAREWAESWVAFADELLQARKTIAGLREQRQRDFAEIMELRGKLHEYEYPHTKTESETLL